MAIDSVRNRGRLLTVAFRNNQARVRYWLWLSASLKFLVPFWLLISLGSHLGWAPAAQKIAAQDVSFVVEFVAQPFAAPPFVSSSHAASGIPMGLLCAWMFGFVVMVLIRLRSWLCIRAALRTSKPVDIPAAVEVRSSPGLLEPGVVGLWKPVILIPEGILPGSGPDDLTPSQLEAVLSHELCHVRRHDNLLASIHMVVEAVFWFHPLVWWIGARLLEERERACDEGVLSLGSEPRIYADAILNVCRLCVESPLACVSGVTGASLRKRIEAIMTNRTGCRLNGPKKFLLACAGVAVLAGPVAIGVLIGIGHAPAVHAQSPLPIAKMLQMAPAMQAAATTTAQQLAAVTTAKDPYQDRRLVAMLFDFGSMNSNEQWRAVQSGIEFVHNLKPSDMVAVMAAENGKAAIVQDFTADQAVLELAILKLRAGNGNTPSGLSGIESVANLVGAFPEKKALIYYSAGTAQVMNDQALAVAVQSAKAANMAIYPIDVTGLVPPGGVPQDEYNRRRAYVQANYKGNSPGMSRTYMRYGPPDTIDDRGANVNPSQIWRYKYLENFHSSVEFEFTQGKALRACVSTGRHQPCIKAWPVLMSAWHRRSTRCLDGSISSARLRPRRAW